MITAQSREHGEQTKLSSVAAAPMFVLEANLKTIPVGPQMWHRFGFDRIGTKGFDVQPENIRTARSRRHRHCLYCLEIANVDFGRSKVRSAETRTAQTGNQRFRTKRKGDAIIVSEHCRLIAIDLMNAIHAHRQVDEQEGESQPGEPQAARSCPRATREGEGDGGKCDRD